MHLNACIRNMQLNVCTIKDNNYVDAVWGGRAGLIKNAWSAALKKLVPICELDGVF